MHDITHVTHERHLCFRTRGQISSAMQCGVYIMYSTRREQKNYENPSVKVFNNRMNVTIIVMRVMSYVNAVI
jgi:hypothetical protein